MKAASAPSCRAPKIDGCKSVFPLAANLSEDFPIPGIAISRDSATEQPPPRPAITCLAKAKILGVRAGTEHRYTGVWVVVVEGRVFVRSWNDKPTGWYRSFQAQPLGSIQLAGREIAIRARQLRGELLRDAVTRAYARKYDTKASEKWVRGFAESHRFHPLQ